MLLECRKLNGMQTFFINVPQIQEIKNVIPASRSFNRSTYFVYFLSYILENTIYVDLELLHTK